MIRLIISDIDGTLVPEGESRINSEYFEVIQELIDKGIRFAAASGRQVTSVDAVFHRFSDRMYYLSDNGACIQKDGEVLEEICMAKEDVKELLRDLQQIPGHHVLLSGREGYYTDDKSTDFHHLVFEQYKGVGSVVEDLEKYTDACIKVSLYCEEGAQILYDLLDDEDDNYQNINQIRDDRDDRDDRYDGYRDSYNEDAQFTAAGFSFKENSDDDGLEEDSDGTDEGDEVFDDAGMSYDE